MYSGSINVDDSEDDSEEDSEEFVFNLSKCFWYLQNLDTLNLDLRYKIIIYNNKDKIKIIPLSDIPF